MWLCAVNIEEKFIIAFPDIDSDIYIDRMQYKAWSVTVLGYSYVLVQVGVAFLNASPLISERTSDECISVLLFSGWFSSVVKIYNNYSFKIDIMSSLSTLETEPSATLAALHKFVYMNLVRHKKSAMISKINA